MRRIGAVLLFVVTGLNLTGCGGQMDDSGTLSVNMLGDGVSEVTGTGIQCPGTCEREVKFSQAQIVSIKNDDILLSVDIAVNDDSELLGWLLTGRAYYSDKLQCTSGPTCDFAMTEICIGAIIPTTVCAQNNVRDIELRPVVMNKNTLIDWDSYGRALCALKQPGEVQCWQDEEDVNRKFERATPPVLVNPTQVATGGYHACVLDQTGVHCWAAPGSAIVTEPSVRFGLQNVERIAVRTNNYGCALWENTVTCWQGTELAQVPELVAPTNLVRKDMVICVDDGDEEVCWGTIIRGDGNFEYVEYRTPLGAVPADI